MNELQYDKDFQKFLRSLSTFASEYVLPIRTHLVDIAIETYNDKTIVKLLERYTTLIEKRKESEYSDFEFAVFYNIPLDDCNDVLNNPKSIKDTLDFLLVNEWWSEYNKNGKNK